MRLWLLPLLFYAATVRAGDAERVFDSVRASVVTISTLDEHNEIEGEGSGVVVNPGQVVTNCHVVQEAAAIRVRNGGKELTADWTLADTQRDLCLLDVKGLTAPVVKIRSHADIRVGEPAYAVGNPLGFGLAASAGIVSSVSEIRGQTQILTSAPISPGSSGGGLFDADGRLIGITTRFFNGAQNLNVALPADWVGDLFQRGTRHENTTVAVSPDRDWQTEAEALRTAGHWSQLAELTRQWGVAFPTSAQAGTYLGLALSNLNRPQEAKQALLAALQRDAHNATARSYLASALYSLGEKVPAMDELQRAIVILPSAAYFHRVLAGWQRDQNEIDSALTSVQTAIRLGPGDEASWRLLGDVYFRQKRFNEAIEAYRAVLRLKPNDPAATTNLAAALIGLGDTAAARQVLTVPLAEHGDNAGNWIDIGVAEDKQGHYAEAERAYRKALEVDPGLPVAWHDLALTLMKTNRTQEAEEALRQALKLAPEFAYAWLNLGGLLGGRGDKAGEKQAYEKATTADAKLAAGWYALGLSRRDFRDIPGALAALERAAELEPSNAVYWAVLGEARLRSGRTEEAFKALMEAESIDPKSETALGGLSMYYGAKGDNATALGYAERALAVNPASSPTWSNKGYALLKLKRYPEASTALETAVRLEPGFGNAWINLGEAYLRQQQLGKSIAALQRALTIVPTAVDAQLYISQAFAATGQFPKATEHLDRLLRQVPSLVPAWYLLTMTHVSQGDKSEALAAYAKLKSLSPSAAHELRARVDGSGRPSGVSFPE